MGAGGCETGAVGGIRGAGALGTEQTFNRSFACSDGRTDRNFPPGSIGHRPLRVRYPKRT